MARKRADGEGTIRKRVDGRWEATIVVGHKDDGKPITRSVYAKTQKDLIPKMRRLVERYQGVELKEESSMTVREWLEIWLEEYAAPRIRASTLDGYRSNSRKINAHIGDKQIRSVTTADCQRMYNKLKKYGREVYSPVYGTELADATIRGIHMMLHVALLDLDAASSGEHWGTTFFTPKGVLSDQTEDPQIKAEIMKMIPYNYWYTVDMERDHHVNWDECPERAAEMLRSAVEQGQTEGVSLQ